MITLLLDSKYYIGLFWKKKHSQKPYSKSNWIEILRIYDGYIRENLWKNLNKNSSGIMYLSVVKKQFYIYFLDKLYKFKICSNVKYYDNI